MSEYVSNISIEQAAALLKNQSGSIAVLTHAKPDGDAFGAVVAVVSALNKQDINAHGYLVPPVPNNFKELKGADLVSTIQSSEEINQHDFFLIVDTGARAQVGFLDEFLQSKSDNIMIVDHHLSGDIAAKFKYIDSKAGAVCEIVWQLVNHLLDEPLGQDFLSQTIREAIFVGIVSDTGWFRFSNTRPITHTLAAQLIEEGVNHSELFHILEQQERPEKLKLLVRAIASLELLADERIAVMTLTLSDFEETGAYEEETERLVDIPQKVGTVQLVVLISEKLIEKNGISQTICRMSFRSKSGPNAIDVAHIASHFGGGGHARAAGAKVSGTAHQNILNVRETLIQALEQ
ncbi:NanoRNase/pAp phosphatase [Poriferisphaera corsica]|uniref:NanoRNase/pAp phosphatase n=1 Tax=Poriferisphaera corsica TaxID=2528020 RepID=A0A517YUF4_9BACT|nr:DHH family phosphoesterase [Poriferisphaera corsica]QDU33870.1 NanoRNase/pAp phosphatase [Poriferisphaera corsica]